MDKKVRIALIYGGKSGEHDVSLLTALAVIKAFDFSKYEIKPIYINKYGKWHTGDTLTAPLESKDQLAFGTVEDNTPISVNRNIIPSNHTRNDVNHSIQALLNEESPIDVVFPLLHGTFGEDGTIQGLLEMLNLPYVGAGVLASAVGMDKVMMKKIFAQEGLPQCMFRHFTKKQWEKDQAFCIMEIEISLGYPCFVKPANLGSSVGITKAANRDQLMAAVQFALQYDRKVMVEESIIAREIEVSVLGNEEPIASVPGEIVSTNEFYDYKAKYIDGSSTMIIPAELSAEQTQQFQNLAIRAFQAIDGSGLSRVDFFLVKEDGRLLINEINTMPGFTPFSMYPLLWKESGKPYKQLLDDLIKLAMERHKDKQEIEYNFDA
jgi:D-alanine-D-alanine ligase